MARILQDSKRRAIYEFSPGVRLTHWARAISIVVLVFTGFYLSYVFQSPTISAEPTNFLQAKYRFVHEVAGFLLLCCIIFKSYLFLTDKTSRKERVSLDDVKSPRIWLEQIKFYLFLGKHPQIKGVYNPLQFVSYVLFYIVIFLILLTGLVLYTHTYHEGLGGVLGGVARYVEAAFGGLAEVRTWHRLLMWVIIVFVPIHIYMAVFNAIRSKDGAMDAIFSGYKFDRELR